MKSLKTTTISLILTFSIIFSSFIPVKAATACRHNNYTDIYTTSEYTGEYTTNQHEVLHYYNRKCKDCGQKIGEPTETVWKNHSIKNNKCECGYTVEQCKHAIYIDTYVTSEYTGGYTADKHEVLHYYNRECEECGRKLGEPTETVWKNHSIKNNKCECGYTVEQCKHTIYTDTYVTSEYTGDYTADKHEVLHYYNRECKDCGKKLGEPTEIVWKNHSIKNNKCECGYTVEECKHTTYIDTYVTSEYTGKYSTSQHEVLHYYNRECKECGKKLGEPTETVWKNHSIKNNKCECGYTVEECKHTTYIDTYVTSEYTGKYSTSQHEVLHYYNRECKDCGKKLGEPTETVWINHSMKNNQCDCGYTVEECEHTSYIDTYKNSEYTGEYTTSQHEVLHHYKRICRDCGETIGTPIETIWVKHQSSSKCLCGYVSSPDQKDATSEIAIKFNVDVDNRIQQLNTLINATIPNAYSKGIITLEKRDKLLKDIKNTLNEYSEVKSGKRSLKNVNELQENYLAKSGSESPVVIQIQKQLITLGYTSQKETGIYDDITYNNVLYFQLINDLELNGWLDETTVDLINSQSKQKIENYEKPYGKITNLKNTRYDLKKGYELKVECNSAVKKAYIQFLNPRDFNKFVGPEQFEIDLENGIVTVSVNAKCTYDCYLYLIGENDETSKVYQGTIEFCDLLPNSFMSKVNLFLGIKDAFVDNIGGILNIAQITVNSSWQGAKNKFYLLTNQQDKIQTTEIEQLLGFVTKAMFPGSEENRLLDQMLVKTFGDLLYKALNSTEEERQRAIGYVIGEILFGYLLSAGIAKAADCIGDFSKVARGAIEIADDTINIKGQYVDDIAKYADDVAEAGRVSKKVINQYDDVIAYIKQHGKLPDNYITKNEAYKLGWISEKGNLAQVAPGKSIGGDVYKNFPHKVTGAQLPVAEGRIWYEADIGYTFGYRGNERLLYSSDGLFYKTDAHYAVFEKIGD